MSTSMLSKSSVWKEMSPEVQLLLVKFEAEQEWGNNKVVLSPEVDDAIERIVEHQMEGIALEVQKANLSDLETSYHEAKRNFTALESAAVPITANDKQKEIAEKMGARRGEILYANAQLESMEKTLIAQQEAVAGLQRFWNEEESEMPALEAILDGRSSAESIDIRLNAGVIAELNGCIEQDGSVFAAEKALFGE